MRRMFRFNMELLLLLLVGAGLVAGAMAQKSPKTEAQPTAAVTKVDPNSPQVIEASRKVSELGSALYKAEKAAWDDDPELRELYLKKREMEILYERRLSSRTDIKKLRKEKDEAVKELHVVLGFNETEKAKE